MSACRVLPCDTIGVSIHEGKELKMNTMEITAKVFDTDEEVTVTPMAVFRIGDFSTIYITDPDGRGLWLDRNLDWKIDVEEGDIYDAEVIEGIFGGDGKEWEASANEKLAGYGFRLGDFDKEHGDRYFLAVL